MNTPIQIMVEGKQVMAIELAFEPKSEPWAEYELVDGGRIRLRCTANRFFWLVDEEGNPKRDPTGVAMIVANTSLQTVANA